MSPMAHSRHGAMSDLGPQKRVKADVTEGTVIIATMLEVGRGRVAIANFTHLGRESANEESSHP